jgi:ribosomal protein S7
MAGMTEGYNILLAVFSALCLSNDMMALKAICGVANKALTRFKPQIAVFSVQSVSVPLQMPVMVSSTRTASLAVIIALWRVLLYLLPC